MAVETNRGLCFVLVAGLTCAGCYALHEVAEPPVQTGSELEAGVDSKASDSGGAEGMGEAGGAEGMGEAGGAGIDDKDGDTTDEACTTRCRSLEWIEIQGGTFRMGSPPGQGAAVHYPQHEVTVPSFEILKTEVTVSQYRKCFDAGVCRVPQVDHSGFSYYDWDKPDRGNHPVNGVDWSDAKAFSEWVGGRLPSEAEWEYAARSEGQDITYPWGDEGSGCEYAVVDFCSDTPVEVCSRPLGNTDQGLCDMAGNVLEWVEDDWHRNYVGAPTDGGAWIDEPRDEARTFRSNTWRDGFENSRCVTRSWSLADNRGYYFGFRVVRGLE